MFLAALIASNDARIALEKENLELSRARLEQEKKKVKMDRIGRVKENESRKELELDKFKLMMQYLKSK